MSSNNKVIKFGIIGTGGIAKVFIDSVNKNKYLNATPKVVAILSRDLQRAKELIVNNQLDIHGDLKVYDDINEFCKDPSIDIVYIASPHYFHYEQGKVCLENKKHVLCEKSFTINAKEAKELIELAKKNNVFLMEAMWTRFFPIMFKLRELLQNNEIGKLSSINVCLGFNGEKKGHSKDHRLYSLELGGGALLDLGVYCISMIQMIVKNYNLCHDKKPLEIKSFMNFDNVTKTDNQCSAILKFENNLIASFHVSFLSEYSRLLEIFGSEGVITVKKSFHNPSQMILEKPGSEVVSFEMPLTKDNEVGSGFYYEIDYVMNCLLNEKKESDIISLDDTLSVMEMMDSIRKEHGLIYPKEK
ncbi:hypothetical protein ABK040_008767 [Willaertia magna]